MREIKFRGKRLDNSRDWENGDCDTWIINSEFRNDWCKIDKNTLGQYTGLKDKNGKEIYEGDIIKIITTHYLLGDYYDKKELFKHDKPVSHNLIVEYDDKCAEYEFRYVNENSYYPRHLITHPEKNYSTIEVIGNIFDNPEILK